MIRRIEKENEEEKSKSLSVGFFSRIFFDLQTGSASRAGPRRGKGGRRESRLDLSSIWDQNPRLGPALPAIVRARVAAPLFLIAFFLIAFAQYLLDSLHDWHLRE